MPTITTHNSYGSRVGNSIKSIFVGIVVVIASIVLLCRNEKNYIQQKRGLEEGASIVQETTASEINPSLDQKEVHLTGETSSDDEALVDNDFGITVDDLKLMRTVEMYQWYEESDTECHDNIGGSEDCVTTYDYYKKWSDSKIDSNSFRDTAGHNNPSTWEYNSNTLVKSPINLGAYTLTDVFVNSLVNYQTLDLTKQNVVTPENYISNTGRFHIGSNYIYIGANPNSPIVGDLKITFSSVKTGTVSIVGKQSGNELRDYIVSNGVSIALLQQGNVSAQDMFIIAQKANKNITRILRGVGLLLMFCGFTMMLKFIETIAKVLPFVANIIGFGTSLIALCLTLVVGLITIGLAWIAVRPILGISCLVLAVAGIFFLGKGRKGKKSNNNGVIDTSKNEIIEEVKDTEPKDENNQ